MYILLHNSCVFCSTAKLPRPRHTSTEILLGNCCHEKRMIIFFPRIMSVLIHWLTSHLLINKNLVSRCFPVLLLGS